jgi:hypothetical protein
MTHEPRDIRSPRLYLGLLAINYMAVHGEIFLISPDLLITQSEHMSALPAESVTKGRVGILTNHGANVRSFSSSRDVRRLETGEHLQ